MKPIGMTDGGRGRSHHKRNPLYSKPKMGHYSSAQLSKAVRMYERAIRNCKDELKRRSR